MESKPVEVYPVHDYLRSRLCTLYENDSIFDRFECGWNGDDTYPGQAGTSSGATNISPLNAP